MPPPSWRPPLVWFLALTAAVMGYVSSQEASSLWSATSVPAAGCQLVPQVELVTCRGVNATHLTEELSRLRDQTLDGPPAQQDDDRTDSDNDE